MEYRYEPQGVCSQEMIIEVDGDTIKKVTIEGFLSIVVQNIGKKCAYCRNFAYFCNQQIAL